jgi:hypothetical protein
MLAAARRSSGHFDGAGGHAQEGGQDEESDGDWD